jgi:hypothetical protein
MHAYICVDSRLLHLIERKTKQTITDLKDKQIEIIALMNSWVFSRLIAENERAGETLAREMDTVAEAEREQGMSPPPLASSSYAFCFPGTRALLSESHALYFSPSFALTYPWFFGTCSRSSH